MISKRAQKLLSKPSAIVEGAIACSKDPYSSENPEGFLNFGIAENRVMDEMALELLKIDYEPTPEHIHYGHMEGLSELREAFCAFARKYLNVSEIMPDKIAVQTGLSSMCESLSFALFEEGDEIIVPAPFYTGFKFDFEGRFGVKLVAVQPGKDFKNKLTDRTKGFLLTNPTNPTGEVLTDKYLLSVIDFCKSHNLHLISDEIYALSIHDGRPHKSVLTLEKEYKNIHFLYGMAKDFSLAGIKTGFYYSRNEECLNAIKTACYFHPVSSQTQSTVANILSDTGAVEAFTKTSNKKISSILSKIKKALPKLKFKRPESGMFFLADFRTLLKKHGDEKALFNFFLNELKLNMTPGTEMGLKEQGYFRVCYARSEAEVDEFIKRIKKVLN